MTGSWDAIVVGGGPAGSAAARMLARLGHRVLLINRGTGGHPGLAQSIPPSTRRTLAALDLLDAVERAPATRGRFLVFPRSAT